MNKKLKKIFTLLIMSVLVFSSIPSIDSSAASGQVRYALYRFYNQKDHFYTIDVPEGVAAEKSGYKFESPIGTVYSEKYYSAHVPVYRYYNGYDHFYTTDWNELGSGKNGYTYEKVAFYATSSPNNSFYSNVPVYRYYNGKDHFYTTNWNELGNGDGKYKYEKIAFYVISA